MDGVWLCIVYPRHRDQPGRGGGVRSGADGSERTDGAVMVQCDRPERPKLADHPGRPGPPDEPVQPDQSGKTGRSDQTDRSRRPGEPDRLRGRRWRFRLVAYGLPVTAVAMATWFSPGRFLAAGDATPYLRQRDLGEALSAWSHQVTGAGSASRAVLQTLDLAILRATAALGLSADIAQHLLYLLCFGLAAGGAAYLAAVWVRRAVAVAAAGLLGGFNAFLMVQHPNVLPVLAVGLTGLLAGMVLRAAQGARVRPVTFAAVWLLSSYLAQSPPLWALLFVTVVGVASAATLLVGAGGARRAWRLLFRALPVAVLLNLWWLVPYAQTMLGGAGPAAIVRADPAAWAQVHNSVANVLTLNAHWDGGGHRYFPFASAPGSTFWSVLRWVPPALALFGVLVAARRRVALVLAGAGAVLVFLAKGVHEPWANANLWLHDHVPGLWLLRDPGSTFTVLLVAVYAVLAAFALDWAAARLGTVGPSRRSLCPRWTARWVVAPLVVLAALAAVSYPWPLWTGVVPPAKRAALPGARVAVPAQWYRAAAAVDTQREAGKVLVLPVDAGRQVTTDWGYHGADFLGALFRRPVVQRPPGGRHAGGPGYAELVDRVQAALLGGDTEAVPRLLRALGVTDVLVRNDLVAGSDQPVRADAASLRSAVHRVGELRAVGEFGVADLYRLRASAAAVYAADELVSVRRDDPTAMSAAVAALPAGQVATGSAAVSADAASWQTSDRRTDGSLHLARAGTYQLTRTTTSTALYRATVQVADGRPVLALHDADQLTVDGAELPARRALSVPLTSSQVDAVSVDGVVRPMPAADGVLTAVGADTEIIALAAQGTNTLRPVGSARLTVPPPVVVRRHLSAGDHRIHFLHRGADTVRSGPPRAAPLTLVVSAQTPRRTTPSVQVTTASPGRYTARISGAHGRFVLVLPETYADGWALRGLPTGWQATHLQVNGYANGWLVTGSGSAAVTLSYQPARWSWAALLVSLAVGVALLVGLVVRLVWRVCRPRRRPTPRVRLPRRDPIPARHLRRQVALDLAVLRCRTLPRAARVRFVGGKLLRLPLILAGVPVTLRVGSGFLRASTPTELDALQSALVDVHDSLLVPGILTSTDTPVVVDVGANTGQFAAATKLAYPGSRIICLEPDPDAFGALQRHAASLRDVTVVRCAVGREADVATLFRDRQSVTSSLVRPSGQTYDPIDTELVRVVSLDDLLADLPRIDLLKIDVAGAEQDVLCGATDVLRRTRYLLVDLGLGGDAERANLELLQFVKQHAPDARIVRFGRPPGSSSDVSCQDVVIALFPASAVRITPPTPTEQLTWWRDHAGSRTGRS